MVPTIDDKSPLGNFIIARNLARQYDFLHTAFVVWGNNVGFNVSHRFIGELNFYGVQFVSDYPGGYRSQIKQDVKITNTEHQPPKWQDVDGHMEDFLAKYAAYFEAMDPITLAAYVLWRINWIHPFIQGNGRTARALSYFALCQKSGFWLPGNPIIPELIRASRPEYCALLRDADASAKGDGTTNLDGLVTYLGRLLKDQLSTVGKSPEAQG